MGQQRGQYLQTTEALWVPFTLSGGNNVIVQGQTGRQIKVYAVVLTAATSVGITFKDGSTAFSGAMPCTAMALDLNDKPMICSSGNSFVITSDGAAAGMAFVQVS